MVLLPLLQVEGAQQLVDVEHCYVRELAPTCLSSPRCFCDSKRRALFLRRDLAPVHYLSPLFATRRFLRFIRSFARLLSYFVFVFSELLRVSVCSSVERVVTRRVITTGTPPHSRSRRRTNGFIRATAAVGSAETRRPLVL